MIPVYFVGVTSYHEDKKRLGYIEGYPIDGTYQLYLCVHIIQPVFVLRTKLRDLVYTLAFPCSEALMQCPGPCWGDKLTWAFLQEYN